MLSEETFAKFTDILCNCGCISLDSAAGTGQTRYNKDMNLDHAQFVTGRKGKKVDYDEPAELGSFHCLSDKLQDSLLAVVKKNSVTTRMQFSIALHDQPERRTRLH